jgi:ribonuclease P protein component
LINSADLEDKPKDFSFGKDYKLCSRRVIDELFEKGEIIKQYPLRLLYTKNPTHFSEDTAFQIVISVPKKKIRKAHDRNKVKRMIREQVRLNKHHIEQLLNKNKEKLALFLIYSETTILDYSILEKKTKKLFQQLYNTLNNEQN